MVIISNGLPDGYEPPSMSLDPTCSPKWATPDEPACAACDKPVEILADGTMVHPDGTTHEEWSNHERLAVAQARP